MNINKLKEEIDENLKDDAVFSDESQMLDYVEECPVVFQSQQRGEPDLTRMEKRRIAIHMLRNKPSAFLMKFGKFLTEDHLNYFLKKYDASYEIIHYVKNLKSLLTDHGKNVVKRNRRFEAMKRMEAEGNYFSEAEMEKREPLLYHQLVGQYMSEQEKLKKSWEASKNRIPTFSNFLIEKIEREELNELLKIEKNEEGRLEFEELSYNNFSGDLNEKKHSKEKWGVDWEDEENYKKTNSLKPKIEGNPNLNQQEKALLFEEFKSIVQNKFLTGQDVDFNYSEVDSNSDYDCLDIRTQDEEERYFDEETCDSSNVCTDTGVEDY